MTTKALRLDRGQIEVVDEKVAEIMRAKSGPERLIMAWDAWTFFEKTIRVHLRASHPEWTEEQILKEIARRVAYGAR